MRFHPPGGPTQKTVTVPKPTPLYHFDCVLHSLSGPSVLPDFFFSFNFTLSVIDHFAIFASKAPASLCERKEDENYGPTRRSTVSSDPTRCSQTQAARCAVFSPLKSARMIEERGLLNSLRRAFPAQVWFSRVESNHLLSVSFRAIVRPGLPLGSRHRLLRYHPFELVDFTLYLSSPLVKW
jgi:hypothetical protein